ncbi:hypothetical protein BG006_007781, partial [Podila minutissima]
VPFFIAHDTPAAGVFEMGEENDRKRACIGAQALTEALKTNSTQTTLDLQNNSIGDNRTQTLSAALMTNSTLTTLDL